MFQALRAAARPATLASRSALRPSNIGLRALSTTAPRLSGPAPPSLYGTGAKPGEIPTDEAQSTGIERFQVLGELQGVEVFDLEPLDSSRIGTLENPIKVFSLDTERIVGCTGSPADSHELHWFTVKLDKTRRCPECGSAHALDFQGSLDAHDDHHH